MSQSFRILRSGKRLTLAALALAACGAAPLPPIQAAVFPFRSNVPGTLEAEVRSEFSLIRVRRQGTVRSLIFVRDSGQEMIESMINLKKPHELLASYSRFMFASYLLAPKQQRALIVGLGGGAMVHFYRHYDPDVKVDAVEIDPQVVRIAKEFFATPSDGNSQLITDDAFHFLPAATTPYDVIYMDAFLKPSAATDMTGLPLTLKTVEFYKGLRRKLTPDGLVVVNLNVHPRVGNDLAVLRTAFAQTYVFKAQTPNLVVLCQPEGTRLSPAESPRPGPGNRSPLPGDVPVRGVAQSPPTRVEGGTMPDESNANRRENPPSAAATPVVDLSQGPCAAYSVREEPHAAVLPGPPPPPAPLVAWYVTRLDGCREGPLTGETLQMAVASGRVRPDDLLWREGMADWAPARQAADQFFRGGGSQGPPPVPLPMAQLAPPFRLGPQRWSPLPALARDDACPAVVLPLGRANLFAVWLVIPVGVDRFVLGRLGTADRAGGVARFRPGVPPRRSDRRDPRPVRPRRQGRAGRQKDRRPPPPAAAVSRVVQSRYGPSAALLATEASPTRLCIQGPIDAQSEQDRAGNQNRHPRGLSVVSACRPG